MLKAAIAASVLLLFSTTVISAAPPPGPIPVQLTEAQKIQEQIVEPTVQIHNNFGSCTGTIFASNKLEDGSVVTLVLTAKHCVNPKNLSLKVVKQNYTIDGELIASTNLPSEMVAYSTTTDLAVIRLNDSQNVYKTVKLGKELSAFYFGQDTWYAGFPAGRSMVLAKGTLGRVEELENATKIFESVAALFGVPDFITDKKFLRSTSSLTPGSSGGPLFTKDENGDFVQIGVASVVGMDDYMAYYVSLKQIHSFLGI